MVDRLYAVANSTQLGIAKPSSAYFDAALRLANVHACEALFIDDSLSNVRAAESAGMLSLHFTGHAALASFLDAAGAFGGGARCR